MNWQSDVAREGLSAVTSSAKVTMQTTSRAGQDLGKSDGVNIIWNPYTRTVDTTPINGSGSGGRFRTRQTG